MVIGSGLMAQTFLDYKMNTKVLVFASGVSNSTETDVLQFEREEALLKKTMASYPEYKIVYFSTVSIEDVSVRDRPYIAHKLALESYIKKNASNYLILRISNVVGPMGNSQTIINYLVNAITNNLEIDIWSKAERNIIDTNDVKYIVDALLKRSVTNKTINIASSKSVLVTGIVKQIELYLHKKVNANYITKGNALNIDVSDISEELQVIDLQKGSGIKYIYSLLEKYY